MSAELSWIVTIVGLIGFWLAGNKVWWAWYINIANQVLWVIFAVASGYYAFLLGTAFYLFVFVKNAIQWTRGHLAEKQLKEDLRQGLHTEMDKQILYGDGQPMDYEGLEIKSDYYDDEGVK